MKIIHVADIHLGSSLEFAKTKYIRDELRRDIRTNFVELVRYANTNNIKIILISGDLFDSDFPLLTDKEFFYNVVQENKEIDFIYLRGNHDKNKDNINLPNLKTFANDTKSYLYDDVAISGLEFNRDNGNYFYNNLKLSPNYKNILMLHGEISNNEGPYKINLSKLSNKNINYLALGHIHKMSIARYENFYYAYPGCLMGRSFDELGPKGFILIDTNDFKLQFIEFSKREFIEYDLNVSECDSDYVISEKISRNIKFNNKDLYQINLTGQIDFILNIKEIEANLANVCYFLTIKNKTRIKINYESYLNDKGIKGEFIRLVLKDNTLNNEDKAKIIVRGLNALKGEVEDETC